LSKNGRVKRVYVQDDAPYRMLPEDLDRIYVRTAPKKMVPFSAFANSTGVLFTASGAFKRLPLAEYYGEPARDTARRSHAGTARAGRKAALQGLRLDWNALSYQEKLATNQGPILYVFSVW